MKEESNSETLNAILVYIVSKYNEVGNNILGRTIMQKIAYFLTFVKVPLPYRFKLYHYGPFSQELLDDMDFLDINELISDRCTNSSSNYCITSSGTETINKFERQIAPFKNNIDKIVDLVRNLDAKSMERFSTTHYVFWARKNYTGQKPSKDAVVNEVLKIKKSKFSRKQIESAFEQIKRAGMFGD